MVQNGASEVERVFSKKKGSRKNLDKLKVSGYSVHKVFWPAEWVQIG